jgi:hypothetical protein
MNELVGIANLRAMEIVVRGGAATCEGRQPKSGVRMGGTIPLRGGYGHFTQEEAKKWR